MKKVCKIRIYPNKSQIKLINETLGCCRYIQNLYIDYNIRIYKEEERFISGYEFSKIINKLKKTNERYYWLSNYSSKAIKDAIKNGEKSFKKFFKNKKTCTCNKRIETNWKNNSCKTILSREL